MQKEFKLVKKIKRKGYPTSSSKYPEAHEEADNAERKKYPAGYKQMKHVDSKLSKNELAGTHTRAGKVKISKKVPKKNRKEVKLHEIVEWKADKRLSKKG